MAVSWRRFATLLVSVACGPTLFAASAEAGVSYQDPAGGWRYKLEGNSAFFGPDGATGALDGTWRHDQTDRWDSSAPGDTGPIPNGPAPGGIGQYSESGTGYLRLQDPGNPETHGWLQGAEKSDDSNRRLNLAHQIENDGALPSELVLDNGFTVSFRANPKFGSARSYLHARLNGGERCSALVSAASSRLQQQLDCRCG